MYNAGKIYAADTIRSPTWHLYGGDVSPLDVLNGTYIGVDISRFVSNARQSASEASLTLNWHLELYGTGQPQIGNVLELCLEGVSYWIGIIQAINDYRLQSGEKSMSIVARSRDATPAWREMRRATTIYPVSTPIDYIARQVVHSLGLSDDEILIEGSGLYTVHSNTQLADMPIWQMLTTMYAPAGSEPFVDCRGRIKMISRDITRLADITLLDNRRLIKVAGSRSRATATEVRIKWLNPNLSQVLQMPRVLGTKAVTAGFFQLKQNQDVYFSADMTQRAKDTFMLIKQSANGLFRFCSETYEQKSEQTGLITIRTSLWAPTIATLGLAGILASSYLPDIAPTGGGPTIPVGKIVHGVAEVAVMLVMMSIGTGSYEIWGTPFDWAHTRNTTTAYNSAARPWEVNPLEIENDFVMDQSGSEVFARRELIYAHRSASSYNLTIVDDTRVERGDIIALSDGTKVYVTDYSRDVSSGAVATLDITGFRV